ncbi:pyruvate/2-oxoglutarate dehydrogenase complex dihydrolipoamide dehydrogenase (E3) component [Neolewinella xylanilytica]|uniref:Pyruvate/2-oxoglutarate dehydrogenase complex dihydrolipoamide dehydrogenase (E3) component n=1 Tax=Neolewinella xylanilytica TaxID=1514080 RepID=A0A2S6IBE9_9BACT|nr:FAD-dependent oxidoreductase [Neolewinella xylanilytica]PPK88831.1 pyruvate/2-oxoglutarate dehydrogenase complex dihydrolipoamide dehydrogenase (E3) component [Neolewinella xylanilytica]
MANYTHDLIVIGAGSGGLGAAGFGGALGLNVALIDKTVHDYGGECLNYGCVPSKALLHVAQQFAGARQATRFGLEISGKADMKAVQRYIRERQDIIREHESPDYLRKTYGLDCFIGEAMLTGKKEVTVNGRKLTAPRIVLATGSRPRHLKVKGVEHVKQYDNERVFAELEELPDRLLIVGGGPNSCELAQAFRRLGSEVILLSRSDRLLKHDPAPAAKLLEAKLRAEGVDVRLNTEIRAFPDAHTASLVDDGEPVGSVSFTHLIVAIGRSVRTRGLGLELAGVHTKGDRILTDDYYRTSNPAILTVGDAYGREMFSHGAEKHNTDVWTNLLSPIDKKHKLNHFSWVTFTDPEIATFGLTPEQLDRQGTKYETVEQSFDHDDRAVAADYSDSLLILYLSKPTYGSSKVLGGCMAAPAAGEMIQELHLLQQLGLDYSKLTNKIYAYPVGSRINQKPARDRDQNRLLSPLTKRVLRAAYRLQNR